MRRMLALLAICTVPLTVACSAAELLEPDARNAAFGTGTPIQTERLHSHRGPFSYSTGLTESARIVVRDSGTWANLWGQIWERHSPTPALPSVDFSRDMLIVAAMGTRSSGGYAIHIDSVYQRSQDFEVVIRKVSPGANCIVTAALTQPTDIVRVPRLSGQVHYREKSLVQNC